ncbi:hypothetical protein GCM10009555_050260 [Acrocarpospora macrocephala]|uniref:Uncharacterized protein n=1 Tax=Acrocarpospora macrocephala TaxID=150177 RepID=A0A5M3X246_9ACTN|nr:hypothetical protein [Acrocarpospora macrocephala]GES12853.1 hypothetical protein Amac_064500 [Acrocarpospora macrocephala]
MLYVTAIVARAAGSSDEEAVLLLETPDPRGPVMMPSLAMELGLDPAPGAVTQEPIGFRVQIGYEEVAVELPDGRTFHQPVGGEWIHTAGVRRRVLVAVGYEAGALGSGQVAYALVPL